MQLQLPDPLAHKLARLAALEGKDLDALAIEAIERLVDHDQWFLQEVQKGEDAADRGELLDHAAVKAAAQDRYKR